MFFLFHQNRCKICIYIVTEPILSQCCQELLHQIRRAGCLELRCWKGILILHTELMCSVSILSMFNDKTPIPGSDEAEAPTDVGEKARRGWHWHEDRRGCCWVGTECSNCCQCKPSVKLCLLQESQSLLCSLILRAPRWPIIVRSVLEGGPLDSTMEGLMELEKGNGINFVPCLTWVRRGVAKWAFLSPCIVL